MDDDILKSVSQGSNGAYDEENRRIRKISDELQRLCRLHEEESREGKGNGSRFEIEQLAEQIDKTIIIIRNSRDPNEAEKTLISFLGIDEIGAKCIVGYRLSQLTGIRPDMQKECIDYFEKRLAAVKELAKYDK